MMKAMELRLRKPKMINCESFRSSENNIIATSFGKTKVTTNAKRTDNTARQ